MGRRTWGWVALLLVCACGTAVATTSTDTDFAGAAVLLSGWSQGSLGKTIRLIALLVGMAIGVTTQKLVIPLTFGLVLYFGPVVVDEVFGAVT